MGRAFAYVEGYNCISAQVGACTVYKCRTVTADAVEELAAGAEGAGAELCWVRSGFALCSDGDKMLYMFGGEPAPGAERWDRGVLIA